MCPIDSSAAHVPNPSTPSLNPASPPDIVPKDSLSISAYSLAARLLHAPLLNHSIRVYLYAKHLASLEHSTYLSSSRLPLLFTACILHDIGTTTHYDGPQRFEVEGADAAYHFLRSNELNSEPVSEADAHEVWVAIALHTSPGIGERITPLARLVRLAVLLDFGKRTIATATGDEMASDEVRGRFESLFPRLEVEKMLGDVVVEQALRRPEKAPAASWPGILLRSHKEDPGWEGVNKAF
jgi:hypothetical protein